MTRVLVPDGKKKLADSTAILSAKWLATYRRKVLQPQLKNLKAPWALRGSCRRSHRALRCLRG